MKDFISDEEYENLHMKNDPPDFISDDELSVMEAAPEKGIMDYAKEFGHSSLENAPALGAMAGAVVGGVPGAAIGAYGGKAAQNLTNSYINKEKAPKSNFDYIAEPIEAGAEAAIGDALGSKLDTALKGVKGLGKKGLTVLGPSSEAIEARIAGRAKDNAKSYAELADEMALDARGIGKEAGELDKKAASVLSSKRNIGRKSLTTPIDKAIHDLTALMDGKTVGQRDKHIFQVLDEFRNDLNRLRPQVSEAQIKGFVDILDDNINWSDPAREGLNTILKGLRHEIDYNLKVGHPDFKMQGNMLYAGLMKPVSQRAKVLEAIQKKFNLEKTPNKGFEASDATGSKIKTSTRELKNSTKRATQALEILTGKNYQDLAKDYELSKHFSRSAPNGARRTALGTGIGLALGKGNLAAMAAGGTAGALADTFGGQWAGKIIDTYVKNKAALGPFLKPVEKAIEGGPKSLEVLGAILGADPEFRKRILE